MSRLEQIRVMLESEPDDVFLNFGLAMEFVRESRFDEALDRFDRVVDLDADYLAGHFQRARTLAQVDRIEEAREALNGGIEAARRSGDTHAAGEMAEFLASLG